MSDYFNLPFFQDFWQSAARETVTRGLRIVFIIVVYVIARRVILKIIDAALKKAADKSVSTGESNGRLKTIQSLIRSAITYSLLFVMIVMILHALGVEVNGLITTAGIGGVAFGFGAQKLVKDMIAGFFIIVEHQFKVGEYVTLYAPALGSASGQVEEINMRTTRLRDDYGKLWIFANGDIGMVTNHSSAPVEVRIDIGVAADTNLDALSAILSSIGQPPPEWWEQFVMGSPKFAGVVSADATRITIQVSVPVRSGRQTDASLRLRQEIIEGLIRSDVSLA